MSKRNVEIKEGLNYLRASFNETYLKNHISYFEKKIDKEIEPYIGINLSALLECHNFAAWIRLYTELICNKLVWNLHRAIGDWDNIIKLRFEDLKNKIVQQFNQANLNITNRILQDMIQALNYVIELRHSYQHGGMPNPMRGKKAKIDINTLSQLANPKEYKKTKKLFLQVHKLLEMLPKPVIGIYAEGYLKEDEDNK